MIGGTDIVIPTRAGGAAIDYCVYCIERRWPEAVFEIPDEGFVVRNYWQLALGQFPELFIYRDGQYPPLWNELGADPSLSNTMIYLLSSDEGITLVVDDPSENVMRQIIETIRKGLAQDLFTYQAAA